MRMTNDSRSVLNIGAYFLHGSFSEEITLQIGESRVIKYNDGTEVIFSETALNQDNNFFVPFDGNLVIGRGSNTFVISRII